MCTLRRFVSEYRKITNSFSILHRQCSNLEIFTILFVAIPLPSSSNSASRPTRCPNESPFIYHSRPSLMPPHQPRRMNSENTWPTTTSSYVREENVGEKFYPFDKTEKCSNTIAEKYQAPVSVPVKRKEKHRKIKHPDHCLLWVVCVCVFCTLRHTHPSFVQNKFVFLICCLSLLLIHSGWLVLYSTIPCVLKCNTEFFLL